MAAKSSYISLSANLETRRGYDLNEISALFAESTNLPIYSEKTNWEGEDTIAQMEIRHTPAEVFRSLKRNTYLQAHAACIVGSNWAEFYGFWLGDKAGDTEVLISNVPRTEIMTFLDSMKNIELLTLSDKTPFETGGGLLDQWRARAGKTENEEKK